MQNPTDQYRIAGTVIFYNPDIDVIDNLKTYLDSVDVLYVVDNSDNIYHDIVEHLKKLGKVRYIPNGENLGIAKALNIAAEQAMKDGYDFLLTMDQDSKATSGMVAAMLGCIKESDISRIGILSPVPVIYPGIKGGDTEPCREVLTAMTSGNLLNLGVYREVGPFMDELFIDYVDNEYCFRLMERGFKVIRANGAILEHRLGDIWRVNVLCWSVGTTNHPALRRYYITRNRFYVWGKYGSLVREFIREDKLRFVSEIRNILLFEKDKFNKIKMILKGYHDYKRGRLGKYEPGNGSL